MSAFANLLKDPPPGYAFEISEAGLAYSKVSQPAAINFQPFEPGVVSISPVHDNIQQPEVLATQINALFPGGKSRRRAALILPDYCARVAVLDFDAFPGTHEEQSALVRFRMKKSVPFDVDTAVVSYFAQPKGKNDRKLEVLVAVVAMEIVARYEAPFRAAGFLPGWVTTSTISTLNLLDPNGLTLLVKLSGHTLTAMVLDGPTVKLVRCVVVEGTPEEELASLMHPTVAYIEDELETSLTRIVLCGFGAESDMLALRWGSELGATAETLNSRNGTPGQSNAGLLGYLESVQ